MSTNDNPEQNEIARLEEVILNSEDLDEATAAAIELLNLIRPQLTPMIRAIKKSQFRPEQTASDGVQQFAVCLLNGKKDLIRYRKNFSEKGYLRPVSWLRMKAIEVINKANRKKKEEISPVDSSGCLQIDLFPGAKSIPADQIAGANEQMHNSIKSLDDSELSVLNLMLDGKSNNEIAKELNVSAATISARMKQIKSKFRLE